MVGEMAGFGQDIDPDIIKVDQESHSGDNKTNDVDDSGSGTDYNAGLGQTRSSLISQKERIYRKGRSSYGNIITIFALFAISFVVITFLVAISISSSYIIVYNVWSWFAGDFVIFGFLFIVNGWIEFSRSNMIKDIPTIKINAAGAGVNEINATFMPENGDGLVSPLSHQKCIFYKLTYQRYVQGYNPGTYVPVSFLNVFMNAFGSLQGRSSRHWENYRYASRGVPALLADGSGYLAVDLQNADIDFPNSYYYPDNETGMFGIGGELTLARVGDKRIIENVIPTNKQYFVMGRVSDMLGRLNGKPVKMIAWDPESKLLTVRDQSKGRIGMIYTMLSIASFGIGVFFIIVGLNYFGFL